MANALNMRLGITLGCVWISSMNASASTYPKIARVAPLARDIATGAGVAVKDIQRACRRMSLIDFVEAELQAKQPRPALPVTRALTSWFGGASMYESVC